MHHPYPEGDDEKTDIAGAHARNFMLAWRGSAWWPLPRPTGSHNITAPHGSRLPAGLGRGQMPHLVLLGDSIFDNAAYTDGGPDVVTHLRALLPDGWSASLLAVDGDRTGDVEQQARGLPHEATHLVLSVGGNDALSHIYILDQPAVSSSQVLGLLADVRDEFEQQYRRLITALARRRLPLVICTIYNGNFPDPHFQRLASTALCVFNDVILRIAFERTIGVIDLRLVCNEAEDYANPIEPSDRGGEKIARAIAAAVGVTREAPEADGGRYMARKSPAPGGSRSG
jgi:GDSL-like Lipase/Acylhydrolase family